MSLLNIDKLNVVAIYVSNFEESLKFYTEFLGFEKAQEMSPGQLLYHSGAELTLYLEGQREVRESAEGKYPAVALCLNCADGVNAALKTLEDNNVPIVLKYGEFDGEFAGFHFKDPSGNILEIAGRP